MSYNNNRPECYGDEDYYDPDDESCKTCAYISSCAVRAERNSRTNKRNAYRSSNQVTTRQQSRSVTTTKNKNQPVVYQEADEQDTFFKILTHNVGLEVMQSTADEIANSIRSIPRKDYSTYFKRDKK